MRTLRDMMLRLQTAVSKGLITEDEYKLAIRERSGRTLSQAGNLRPKRGWIGTEVNGERVMAASNAVSRPYSRSVKIYNGKPAAEVQERDLRIAYDRQMVAAGCRSALVKQVDVNTLSAAQRWRSEQMKAKANGMLAAAMSTVE